MIQQTTTPITLYGQYIKEGKIAEDQAQKAAILRLQALYDSLAEASRPLPFPARLFLKKPALPARGLYIWGEVGRGKSMLMDMFFAALPHIRKKRVHFHSFMIGIHKHIHALRQQKMESPVENTAKHIAEGTHVLCLDEFQVTDVADAMILHKLFGELLARNVTVVMTSNRPPEELYLGGLQREKFLDFVRLVHEKMEVFELASEHDYRMKAIRALESVYLFPLTEGNDARLEHIFSTLCGDLEPEAITLEVLGRKLDVHRTSGQIAFFTFAELCDKPLGPADYIAICDHFDTVFISGIPLLSPEKRNEAKRFVTLIDTLYDRRIKLICTAAAPPGQLYPSGDGSFEFHRTVSRLVEMQSTHYIEQKHI